jgi:AcrR family transcriptional regulator
MAARRTKQAGKERGEEGARERILEAAVASFAEVGYGGTTTVDVARRAGITQPLVHHYFGSKEALWRAAIDHVFAPLPTLLAAARRASPEERVAQFLEGFVRMSAARPEIARIIAREGAAPSPRLTYLLDRYLGAPLRAARATVRAGQRAGLVPRDARPELVLFFVLGAGGHVFDVPALVQEAFGVDVTSEAIREEYVALFRALVTWGRPPAKGKER